jgi:medium-chain acyl-[acyl-carrier-protein] hydrolase
MFRPWRHYLLPHVQVVPMELPGHGRRMSEALIADYSALVECMADELVVDLQAHAVSGRMPTYAIFGHSAGARLGFGVGARATWRTGHEPIHLFLSAAAPFCAALRERRRSHLSDSEWRHELQALGGTPPQVLAAQGLLELMLPTLRADFRVMEGSYVDAHLQLDCPLTLIAADKDDVAPVADVWQWSRHSSGACRHVLLHGDHSSVLRQDGRLLDEIRDTLATHGDAFRPCSF